MPSCEFRQKEERLGRLTKKNRLDEEGGAGIAVVGRDHQKTIVPGVRKTRKSPGVKGKKGGLSRVRGDWTKLRQESYSMATRQ